MFSLIIVDDEQAIRKGIRDYIDWESMGYEVADTFEDGKEALDYLRTHKTDVVLTDIEMAQVSGLELARKIQEEEIAAKVVIISGYKEFEYARKAVRYGVEQYLLKPIHMEEVREVFERLGEMLSAEKEEKEAFLENQKKYSELLPELREQFWVNLLMGGLKKREAIQKRLNMLDISVNMDTPVLLANLTLKREKEAYALKQENVNYYNLINNIFAHEDDKMISKPVFLSEDVIKILVISKENQDKTKLEEIARKQFEADCRTACSLLEILFEITIEKTFSDLTKITEYHCQKRVYSTVEAGAVKELSAEDYEGLFQQYKLLMGLMNDGDFEELDNMVDHIFFELEHISVQHVQKICIDMFSMLSGKLVKMGSDRWKAWNQKVSYQEFTRINEVEELKEKVKELLHEAIQIIKEKQNLTSKKFVEESIAYIKEHYAEEISLEIVSNRVFLNQTYFSRLFKQYTGSTFTDYLIKLRMEKAKELLNQGIYKVYEVSEKVGYRSEKYFFRIFKQYTGCSPTEYFRGIKEK